MRLFDTVSQVTHYFKYIKTLNKKAVFFYCHYISGNKHLILDGFQRSTYRVEK